MWFWVLVVTLLVLVLGAYFFFFSQKKKGDPKQAELAKTFRCDSSPLAGKRVLCLVNPYSGNKDGVWFFENVCRPMLEHASVKFDQIVTTHASHIFEVGVELAKSFEDGNGSFVFPEGGVIVFGGDGTLVEFLNGVVKQASNSEMKIDHPKVQKILDQMNIGLLPVGSCNGISISGDIRTPYEAMTKILAGNIKMLDVNEVTLHPEESSKISSSPLSPLLQSLTENRPLPHRYIDIHQVSWGLATESDKLAEGTWRNLGELKLILAPLYCIARKKSYRGTISVLPCPLLGSEEEKAVGYSDPSQLQDDPSREGGWKILQGDFISATISNLSRLTPDMIVAKDLYFDDGNQVLMVIKGDTNRFQLIRGLLALETGSAGFLPYVHLYKVSDFVIEAEESGLLSSSGIVVEHSRKLEVHHCARALRYYF